MKRGIFVVFSSCTDPARQDEFNSWYSRTHLPDLSVTPGLAGARRYASVWPERTGHQYVTLYEFKSDDLRQSARALSDIARQTFPKGRHIDCFQVGPLYVVEEIDDGMYSPLERIDYPPYPPPQGMPEPEDLRPVAKSSKTRAVTLIFSNCSDPSREEEFNRWYSHVHVPDLLATPGMTSGKRYRNVQNRGPRYLAKYEFESDDLPATWREMSRIAVEGRATGRRIECLDAVSIDRFLEIDAESYEPLNHHDYPREPQF